MCNALVLSGITHSRCYEFDWSILWTDVASEVSNDLRERYYRGDLFKIADLQEKLFALQQSDEYYFLFYTFEKL